MQDRSLLAHGAHNDHLPLLQPPQTMSIYKYKNSNNSQSLIFMHVHYKFIPFYLLQTPLLVGFARRLYLKHVPDILLEEILTLESCLNFNPY